jgi:hypothetical protein
MSEVRKKLASMIWLAIDSRTPEPEAQAALAGIRRMNASLDELKLALGNAATEVRVVERTPEFVDPVIGFGKYGPKSGKPLKLSEIVREHPQYFSWLLAKLDEPGSTFKVDNWMRNQIELAILNAK